MRYKSSDAKPVDQLLDSDSDILIAADNLGKTYRLYNSYRDRFKEFIFRRNYGHDFSALSGVSFEVRRGEALGIIGHNGAGKSTLLQILAGTIKPTTGEARIRGRVTSLLELGSGFMPDMTGRANVAMNGAMLGFSPSELTAKMGDIEAFADIGEFMDQPVKSYSSGMMVRLAFAVQACFDPDVLIVDEALAVGDVFFQQKCHARMADLLKRGTAVLLVTHDSQAVRRYCSRVIMLEHGRVRHNGDVEEGLAQYFSSLGKMKTSSLVDIDMQESEVESLEDSKVEVASNNISTVRTPVKSNIDLSNVTVLESVPNRVRLLSVGMYDDNNCPTTTFCQNEFATIQICAELIGKVSHPVIGVELNSVDNLAIYSTSSYQVSFECDVPKNNTRGIWSVAWKVKLSISRGVYFLSIAFADYNGDHIEELLDVSPESTFSSFTPISSFLRIAKIDICAPKKGLLLPFVGLVGLETHMKDKFITHSASI